MAALDAILFFAGGALTLAAGLVAEWYRDSRRTNGLRQLVKQALRDDLQRAVVTYDELIKEYANKDFVSYAHTQAIQDSRTVYDRNRDALLLLDEGLRQDIVNYYLHSSQTIAGLVGTQQRKDAIDIAERGILFSMTGKLNPATGQSYTPASLQAAVQAQLTQAQIGERSLAVAFLKNNMANNVTGLKKEATVLLARLS